LEKEEGMRLAGTRTVLVAAAAAMLWPAAATAGTYDVVSCNAPGAGGVNNAWTPAFTHFGNGPHPEAYDLFDDCRGTERALVARSHVGGEGNARFLTGAAWEFAAPAGTVISRVTVWRHGWKFRTGDDDPNTAGDDGDPWYMGAKEVNGNTVGGDLTGETCNNPAGQPLCAVGSDGGASSANARTFDVSTSKLSWQIDCREWDGCGRYYGTSTAGMELYGARVTLTDNSVPSLTVGGPALAGGWHRPGDAVTYDASDNSGVNSGWIEAGGLIARDGRPCNFTRKVPCSNVSGGRIPLPALPDGEHTVRILAEDAAGNTTAAQRQVLVDGTAPLARLERPRGRTLRVQGEDALSGGQGGEIAVRNSSAEPYRGLITTMRNGRLTARLDRGRMARTDVRVTVRDNAGNQAAGLPPKITLTGARVRGRARSVRSNRVRVPFGRRVVLRGRLTLSAGQPVAGAGVRVVSRVRRAGAPLDALGTVGTDRRGRFKVTIPAGPTRTIGLRFEGREQVLRGARGVSVRVPAASTIRASRRFVSGPGRVRFSGRLRTAGQTIPDRGLVVVLQGFADGRWQTFADVRANTRGRWRASYPFRGIRGNYPVRLRIRRQPGFPFELGYSRRLVVRVR
jgi:hypothetical protein